MNNIKKILSVLIYGVPAFMGLCAGSEFQQSQYFSGGFDIIIAVIYTVLSFELRD